MVSLSDGMFAEIPAYFSFEPRPNQPDRYDEQLAFYDSLDKGVAWLLGGNGAGTTTLALAKVAKFVYETPPPRHDTPFWVIAESYEQVCETAWKEKLHGQGHILDHDIDWDRIDWYKRNNGWPFRVPLKSPAGSRNNWMLEFKSWRQGRGQMQARSLGGFCFIEQFPWGVFEEVSRGCREYNFPGSKLCEYTPVNPDMSSEIEEMIENGPEPEDKKDVVFNRQYLPRGWNVYHANTECAKEAGHVDEDWFEEFFGMIPPEMRDTRMKGLFASFEGVVYKNFHPSVHCMGDEMWAFLDNCAHRRGIDWGAGPENAFTCLWGAKNGANQWFIYDEYYSTNQEYSTVDHLIEVYEQWSWPSGSSYGATYADPSSPDNIRIANKLSRYAAQTGKPVKNISVQRGKNAVLEGIEHIQHLLKPQVPVFSIDSEKTELQPRIFIHRDNCPNLIRQMKKYRWLRGADRNQAAKLNPKNPRREPLKFEDHAVDALRYLCFTDDRLGGLTIDSARTQSTVMDSITGNYMNGKNNWKTVTSQHRQNRE